jgi:hypothetical protein
VQRRERGGHQRAVQGYDSMLPLGRERSRHGCGQEMLLQRRRRYTHSFDRSCFLSQFTFKALRKGNRGYILPFPTYVFRVVRSQRSKPWHGLFQMETRHPRLPEQHPYHRRQNRRQRAFRLAIQSVQYTRRTGFR